jgi:hypothetical protein
MIAHDHLRYRYSREDIACVSAVGVTPIRRAELTESETSLTAANDQAVRRALEVRCDRIEGQPCCGTRVRLWHTSLTSRDVRLWSPFEVQADVPLI